MVTDDKSQFLLPKENVEAPDEEAALTGKINKLQPAFWLHIDFKHICSFCIDFGDSLPDLTETASTVASVGNVIM